MNKVKTVGEWTIFRNEQDQYFAENSKKIIDDVYVTRSTPFLSKENWKERRQFINVPESVKAAFDNIFA